MAGCVAQSQEDHARRGRLPERGRRGVPVDDGSGPRNDRNRPLPYAHGITGHHIRDGNGVRGIFGEEGRADPSDILVPTLADLWSDRTRNRAWIGQIGYQLAHLGLIGYGGRSRTGDQRPVAVYWDEEHEPRTWAVQNPELYRMPEGAPGPEVLQACRAAHVPPGIDSQFDPTGKISECCSTPVIRFEGDLIEATLLSEPVGETGTTDLLFINYKAPDYAGHLYNMLSEWRRGSWPMSIKNSGVCGHTWRTRSARTATC